LAIDRIVNIIFRWLEEHPEVPAQIAAKIDLLSSRTDVANRTYLKAAQSVLEFVERQRLFRGEIDAGIPGLEKFGKKAMDLTAIQTELAIRLRQPIHTIEEATHRTLPGIGEALEKSGVIARLAAGDTQAALQGIGIISDQLSRQMAGISLPRINRALDAFRKSMGLTREDIIKSFYIAYIAHQRSTDQMSRAVHELVGAESDAFSRISDVIERSAETREASTDVQIEAARRGLSAYKQIYDQIVSEEEFLSGWRKKTFEEYMKQKERERLLAEETAKAEMIAEKYGAEVAAVTGEKAVAAAIKRAAAGEDLSKALAEEREKHDRLVAAARQERSEFLKNIETTNVAGKVSDKFAEAVANLTNKEAEQEEETVTLYDKIKFLGRTLKHSSDLYGQLADAWMESTEEGVRTTYQLVKAETDREKVLDEVARAVVQGKGAISEELQAKLDSVQASEEWGDVVDSLSKKIRKQILATKEAADGTDDWGKKIGSFGRRLDRIGVRIGWLSYRTVMMGRIIMRVFTRILRTVTQVYRWIFRKTVEVVKSMANWTRQLEIVATAMALLEAAGLATSEGMSFLGDTVNRLVTLGPRFQAIWVGMQAQLAGIMALVAEGMLPYLEELYSALQELTAAPWFQQLVRDIADAFYGEAMPAISQFIQQLQDDLGPGIVEAARSLGELAAAFVTELLPALIAIIPEIVPRVVNAFSRLIDILPELIEKLPDLISALMDAIPAMAQLVLAISPLIPVISGVIRALGPLAPVLIGVGMALYFLGPILNTIGTILEGVGWLFGKIGVTAAASEGGILAAAQSLGMFLAKIAPVIGIITQVIALLLNWNDAMQGKLAPGVKRFIDITGIATGGLTGLAMAVGAIAPPIGALILAIEGIILAITHWREIVDALTGAWNWFVSVLQPVIDAIRSAASTVADFFMPILQALWNVVQQVGYVFYQLGRVFYELGRVIMSLVLLPFKLLWQHVLRPLWNFLSGLFMTAWNAIIAVLTRLYNIAIKPVIDALTWLWKNVLEPVVTFIRDTVLGVLNRFADALRTVGDWLGGVANALGSVVDWLGSICFRHAAADADKFSRSLDRTESQISSFLRASRDVRSVLQDTFTEVGGFESPEITVTAGARTVQQQTTQYVTVPVTIYVSSVSAEVDLDELAAAVSRGVGDAVRRRLA